MSFWEDKSLAEMNSDEWEALCDGCGLCCHVKLQDEEDPKSDSEAEVFLTDVACRLLDCSTCRCSDYAHRKLKVPECLVLTPKNLAEYANWLPTTCAYRRLHFKQPLPAWHPLKTGDLATVQQQGPSFAGRLISENRVPDDALEDHIVPWPNDL